MKRQYILYLILVLIISSCSVRNKEAEQFLTTVDSLITVRRSDSAQIILDNYNIEELKGEHRARYAVLLTQVHDKNYVVHTNDSLIKTAIDYYENHSKKNKQWLARAYYYNAAVNRDMKNRLEEVKQYLRVLSLIEDSKSYELQALTYGNLGTLFYANNLMNEADSLFQKAIQLNMQNSDTLRWILNITKSSNIHIEYNDNNYENIEKDLLLAKQLYEQLSQKPLNTERALIRSLSYLYERMNYFSETKKYAFRKLKIDKSHIDSIDTYTILGSAYFKVNLYDSAVIYLSRALTDKYSNGRAGAYLRLSNIYEALGNDKEAKKYIALYYDDLDSLNSHNKPVEIISSLKDEVQQQVIAEHQLLFKKKETSHQIIIACVILISLGIIIALYKVYSIRRSKLEVDKEALKKELLEIQKELEVASTNNSADKYDTANADCPDISGSDIYNKFQQASFYDDIIITDGDWQVLIEILNKTYPNFLLKLKEMYKLKPMELRICILLKLHFKPAQIAQIVLRTKQSITAARKRLYFKIFKTEGSAEDFDNFILSL